MDGNLEVSPRLVIPDSELHYSFARSSGPGGQNVNKSNTKVVLRWNVAATRALPGDVRGRFLERYGSRINQRGEVIVASDQHREQGANRRACQERLKEMIHSVLARPRRRVRTKPPRSAVERRLCEKRARSERKQQRRYRGE